MIPDAISIVTVEHVNNFCLRLRFNDNTEQTVDFQPFLSRALHPDIRAWFDPVRFATYRLEYGNLVWGNYDLCFNIVDLYRNQIEHRTPVESTIIKTIKMSQKITLKYTIRRNNNTPEQDAA